ncbi:hypothetical protein ACTA71_006854 [Dictyostelium dimigraforme]
MGISVFKPIWCKTVEEIIEAFSFTFTDCAKLVNGRDRFLRLLCGEDNIDKDINSKLVDEKNEQLANWLKTRYTRNGDGKDLYDLYFNKTIPKSSNETTQILEIDTVPTNRQIYQNFKVENKTPSC